MLHSKAQCLQCLSLWVAFSKERGKFVPLESRTLKDNDNHVPTFEMWFSGNLAFV